MNKYPDISRLFEKKARRRRQLARLSFEEKIAIVIKWRVLSQQIAKVRQHNIAEHPK
ncbi:MAG: hypothetical protein ACREBG_06580 [Pyrinomonadaceae bacterium]